MATDKQIAANRLNAKHSTGPRTTNGKGRSRRNAIRHGLTAETVISVLEDQSEYLAFAAAINADYRPRTNFELELVARLVSLLWRLRRAVAIETGLLSIHLGMPRRRNTEFCDPSKITEEDPVNDRSPSIVPERLSLDPKSGTLNGNIKSIRPGQFTNPKVAHSKIARSFLRLASFDNGVFDRLGRYEMGLWRQTVQIILLLNSINHGPNDQSVDDRFLYPRNEPRKRQRVRWPPFVPTG